METDTAALISLLTLLPFVLILFVTFVAPHLRDLKNIGAPSETCPLILAICLLFLVIIAGYSPANNPEGDQYEEGSRVPESE